MARHFTIDMYISGWLIWVRSRNCGCLVTWFCYQLIAKPGNKTATVPCPDPYYVTGINHSSPCPMNIITCLYSPEGYRLMAPVGIKPCHHPHEMCGLWMWWHMESTVILQIIEVIRSQITGNLGNSTAFSDYQQKNHSLHCWLLLGESSNGPLTHWGQVTHKCISKLTIIGSDMTRCLAGAKPLSEPMLEYC